MDVDELTSLKDRKHRLSQRRTKAIIEHEQALADLDKREASLDSQIDKRQREIWEARNFVGIDYSSEDAFPWCAPLQDKMEEVYKFKFRGLQLEVCSAAMDQRHIIYIAPTGGGKTLTAQLPVLLGGGLALFVVPLKALAHDLRARDISLNIPSAVLTGDTTVEERRTIDRRLQLLIHPGRGSSFTQTEDVADALKLLIVTPEKFVNDNTLLAMLDQLYDDRKFNRIIIDEAHSLADLAFTSRPGYLHLQTLRRRYPDVPVLALSATFTPKSIDTFVRVMELPLLTDGKHAHRDGTLCFVAPLYRPNLSYTIQHLSRPKHKADIVVHWILAKHIKETGIIYEITHTGCKELAKKIQQKSNNKIKTAFYHAELPLARKEEVHDQWIRGQIHLVVCTTSFGMGIDKSNVRYVIHTSMPKSPVHYFQESGRAGRDQLPADCLLICTPGDLFSWASIINVSEPEAQDKLLDMAAFAQDLNTCRQTQFSNYLFAKPPDMVGWSPEAPEIPVRCQNCDNCRRKIETFDREDTTIDRWKILRVVNWAFREKAKGLSLTKLWEITTGKATSLMVNVHGYDKEFAFLLSEVCHSKIELPIQRIKWLVTELLSKRYLALRFVKNGRASGGHNVYLKPGSKIKDVTGLEWECLREKGVPRVFTDFPIEPSAFQQWDGTVSTRSLQKRKSVDVDLIEISSTDDEGNKGKQSTPVIRLRELAGRGAVWKAPRLSAVKGHVRRVIEEVWRDMTPSPEPHTDSQKDIVIDLTSDSD